MTVDLKPSDFWRFPVWFVRFMHRLVPYLWRNRHQLALLAREQDRR